MVQEPHKSMDQVDYVAWCWKAGGNSGNFNIDHEGYSTAGDAAMSIADQNTTGYNTDQNWGAGATGGWNLTQVVLMVLL